MYHSRDKQGLLHPLAQKNVDTGMGFERLVSAVQGTNSVYETDLYLPWTEGIGAAYRLPEKPRRLVCDHLRSASVLIGEGLEPSNLGRGYVLRRLLRRTCRELRLNSSERSLERVPPAAIAETLDQFKISSSAEEVKEAMLQEEGRYLSLLRRGEKVVKRHLRSHQLDEAAYTYLYETHGLPREVVEEIAASS
jgi:alanyl-tRNA synthetase